MTELFTHMLQKITPLKTAIQELEQAQLELLKSETAAEYAANMVRYNEQRVARLKVRIAQYNGDIA
jgi:hypothetical protein